MILIEPSAGARMMIAARLAEGLPARASYLDVMARAFLSTLLELLTAAREGREAVLQ